MNMPDSSEPWLLLLITLGTFIPYRYLIIRIHGASMVSLVSLIVTVILIFRFYLF
jgi:hypothetical protein